MAMKIAILEDNVERQRAMASCLADRFYQYEAQFFDDASRMVDYLREHLEDTIVLSLDHDLELKPASRGRWIDPGTGRDVADYLAKRPPACPIVIHTTNSPAAEGMAQVLQDAHWQTHRVIPFDDLSWIRSDWLRTMRRAILTMARPSG